MTGHPERLALGAYVVGALGPVERTDVDAHLVACPDCRRELAALAPLPGLLSRLGTADATGPAHADPELLCRALSRMRAERSRARRRWAGAAVAGAVAASLATAAVATRPAAPGPTPAPVATGRSGAGHSGAVQLSATDPGTSLSATAELRTRAWGTEVGLRLLGVPPRQRCRLVAVGHDGSREVAGTWSATPGGAQTVTTATSIPPEGLRELDVVGGDGETLLTIPVPS